MEAGLTDLLLSSVPPQREWRQFLAKGTRQELPVFVTDLKAAAFSVLGGGGCSGQCYIGWSSEVWTHSS